MERLRRLNQIWNWLPAFRAVAETQHLPTAARLIGVSAPALSRAIRLVESDLGLALFRRNQRRLVLSEAGRRLLDSVRDAMRRIDDGVVDAAATGQSGPFHIALASGSAAVFVAPTLVKLQRLHPAVVPHLATVGEETIEAGLLDGTIDLAVVERPPSTGRVHVERVAEIRHHVYCGRRHPLHRVRRPTRRQILDAAWVAPLAPLTDAWPPEVPRRVTAFVATLWAGVELCEEGAWLAAFPEAVEKRAGSLLRRLPYAPALPPAALYLVHRRPLGDGSPAEQLLADVRAELARAA
jgi:DNA-binding transcriptional LysR family regulator